MNKKGAGWIIFAIIGMIIIIVVLIITLILVVQKTTKEENEIDISNGTLKFYLKTQDKDTREFLNANYRILLPNRKEIQFGETNKDSYRIIEDVPKTPIEVYCSNENHYTTRNLKEFTNIELTENSSKFTCKTEEMGDLTLKLVNGDLSQTENKLGINITSNKYFKNLGIMATWTSGIIDISYNQPSITCNEWINYSYKKPDDKGFIWFQEGLYLCGEDFYQCEIFNETGCYLPEEDVPSRFKSQADEMIFTGINLKPGETRTIFVDVKTNVQKTNDDYIEFVFYDKEMIFNEGTIKWVFLNEDNGVNLGNPKDFKLRIPYKI